MIHRLIRLGVLPLILSLLLALLVFSVGPNRWDTVERPSLQSAVLNEAGGEQRLSLRGDALTRVNVLYVNGHRVSFRTEKSQMRSCVLSLPEGTVSPGDSIRVGKAFPFLPGVLYQSGEATVSP